MVARRRMLGKWCRFRLELGSRFGKVHSTSGMTWWAGASWMAGRFGNKQCIAVGYLTFHVYGNDLHGRFWALPGCFYLLLMHSTLRLVLNHDPNPLIACSEAASVASLSCPLLSLVGHLAEFLLRQNFPGDAATKTTPDFQRGLITRPDRRQDGARQHKSGYPPPQQDGKASGEEGRSEGLEKETRRTRSGQAERGHRPVGELPLHVVARSLFQDCPC